MIGALGILLAAAQPLPVFVELSQPPAFAAWQEKTPSAQALSVASRLAANLAQQESFLQALQEAGVAYGELYRLQRLLNGVALEVDPEQLPRLQQLPGVVRVYPIVPKRPTLFSVLPLVRALQAWGSYGFTGRGVRVGIIDTGIDYRHRTFGGSNSFPNSKVVGGYDFAGDSYNASSSNPANRTPHPDPDPMDCGGHGTHVASIVGGLGVTTEGNPFPGPFGLATPLDQLRLAPGIAPEASLYALKVFGCQGSTALVGRALEWAADPNGDGNPSDHLDIVNLSLGSDFGSNQDADAVAANRAAQVGILVVAAAGNSGDVAFITSSPGTATAALSVASSVDAGAMVGAFEVVAPTSLAGLYPASEAAFGPDLATSGDVEGFLAVPQPAEVLGCEAFSPASAAALAGKIALIQRGTCTFKRKVLNAQNAGALGVLIVRQDDGDPFRMGNDTSITAPITIPAQMTVSSVGSLLQAHLGEGVRLRLTAAYRNRYVYTNPQREDTVSDFSSRGPRGDWALKPDLAAPGETVFAALRGSSTEGVSLNGTSMATPAVAGAAAILKEAFPQLTPRELKALLMNSADPWLFASRKGFEPYHRLTRVGSGRLNVERALSCPVLLWAEESPEGVSVSFGLVPAPARREKIVKVKNLTSSPLSLQLGISFTQPFPGGRLSVSPQSLALAAGEERPVTLVLETWANGPLLRDPTQSPTQQGWPRFYLSELSAHLQAWIGGEMRAGLPVYGALTFGGNLRAEPPRLRPSSELQLRLAGDPQPAEQSLVVPLLLTYQAQPQTPPRPGRLVAAGVASSGGGDPTLLFGVATETAWASPQEVQVRVYLDKNGDGTPELRLENGRLADTDVFVTRLCPQPSGACRDLGPLGGLTSQGPHVPAFATRLLLLSARASDLGLGPGSLAFWITTSDDLGPASRTATVQWDPFNSPLRAQGSSLNGVFIRQPGEALSFTLATGEKRRILLLFPYNQSLWQTQVVPLEEAQLRRQLPSR